MPAHPTTVEQWLALSHKELLDHVHRLARDGATSGAVWTRIAEHPVLAARVRGILSSLRAQAADQPAWAARIKQVLALLSQQDSPRITPQPHRPAQLVTSPQPPAPRKPATRVPPVLFVAPGQPAAWTA